MVQNIEVQKQRLMSTLTYFAKAKFIWPFEDLEDIFWKGVHLTGSTRPQEENQRAALAGHLGITMSGGPMCERD